MHRFVFPLTFVVCAAAAPGAQAQAVNAPRPNVVLIITDDVGYRDFGSYGAQALKTPHGDGRYGDAGSYVAPYTKPRNVDSRAKDGVRLTDFYANGATCSPTRTGL